MDSAATKQWLTPATPNDGNQAGAKTAWLLLRGIKSILRCDEAEVVHGIARYVISQRLSLRLVSKLIERTRKTPLPAAIALIGWLKSFLSVGEPERTDGATWIARFGNERGAIEELASRFPELGWTELTFCLRPDMSSLKPLLRLLTSRVRSTRRMLRIVRLLLRRHEFFKVLRVVELVGYYTRYSSIFRNSGFSLAVTSNHSNPHGIAFNLAARECEVPVVLVAHGMPVRPVARLSYDLAVVHSQAALRIYSEEGCRMHRVVIHGRRELYSAMPERLPDHLSVGIFLCKDVNEDRLRALVRSLLREPRVCRILIRPHPTNLWAGLDSWVTSQNEARLGVSSGRTVFGDLRISDIVLAGNSSVLVEAVTAGRPSAYVTGLDYGSPDLHSFVARGLIYQFDETMGARVGSAWDPEAILRFYQRADWHAVLKMFANVDESEESVATRIVAVMQELGSSRAVGNAVPEHLNHKR